VLGSRATIRYAKALFELARDEKKLEQVQADLNTLQEALQKSPDLQRVLESPIIPKEDKADLLNQLFQDRVSELTMRFLQLLVEKNRESLLGFIIQRFGELLDDYQGILRGQLISAYAFTPEQLKALKARLDKITGKNVLLEEQVDPQLLGGFVVRIKDTIIDVSLKNQLLKLREHLVSGG
jgi:F-type H+-transporting ATPase subunit delta